MRVWLRKRCLLNQVRSGGAGVHSPGLGNRCLQDRNGGASSFSLSRLLRNGLLFPSLTDRQGSGLYPSILTCKMEQENQLPLIKYLLCAKPRALSPCIASFNPHNSLTRLMLLLYPFYRFKKLRHRQGKSLIQGNTVNGDAEIQTQSMNSGP